MHAFYEVSSVPTQTCVLLDSKAASEAYPTGDVLLAMCESCGLIQNVRFDPDRVDYSKPTEESQAFSATFQRFATGLADDLVERYQLRGKTVLEVGCGKGDFLVLLAERGIGSGVGIDPGFLPNRPEAAADVLEFIRADYSEEVLDLTGDLVLTRHLMEHVPNVGEFFGWLVESVGRTEGAALFTEVPDTRRVLDEAAYWDVYYEHCSYFTLGSLGRALERCGLEVHHLSTGYGGQYLLSGAAPHQTEGVVEVPDDRADLLARLPDFAGKASAGISAWREAVDRCHRRGEGVAIWGGGSKAVAFLAALGVHDVTVVDINPHKQGKWLPSVAVKVEHPQVLEDLRPGLVIPMNAIYQEEIQADLGRMGLDPEVKPL